MSFDFASFPDKEAIVRRPTIPSGTEQDTVDAFTTRLADAESKYSVISKGYDGFVSGTGTFSSKLSQMYGYSLSGVNNDYFITGKYGYSANDILAMMQ